DDAGHLGGGGDVGADEAAGDEGFGDGVEGLPGGEHVEDDAVDVGFGEGVFEGADGEAPGGVGAAEELLDVAAGDVGEVGAAFVGGDEAVFADGAQEGAGEGAGSGA